MKPTGTALGTVAITSAVAVLTAREVGILELMDDGLIYKQIEGRLHLGHSVADKLERRIFRKLHAHTRTEALNHWRRLAS